MEKLSNSDGPARPAWIDRGVVPYLLVAAVSAATMFVQLGTPTLDDHESKAALAARAMIRDGEWLVAGPKGAPMAPEEIPPQTTLNRWLVPVNNGLPRLVKTPMPYWVMAGTGKLLGRVSEWAARAQSAVSAVLCALVVLALGRRMFGPRPALWGALLFATCVGCQKWGRNARPEMILCLCITVAMACFYMGLSVKRRRDRAVWMLAFWASMGLANLAKQFLPLLMSVPLLIFICYEQARLSGRDEDGMRKRLAQCLIFLAVAVLMGIGFQAIRQKAGFGSVKLGLAVAGLLVLAPIAWYAVVTRGWRGIRPLLPTAIPGAILMFAAFLPWMWYMRELFSGAGAVFSEQVAERAVGSAKWAVQPPYYYILPLITLTLPWLGLLPGALASCWLKAYSARRRELVYLTLWSLGLIAMVTVSAGKREHYILPMLPAICLLMGFVADDVFARHRYFSPRIGRALGIAYGLGPLFGVVIVAVLWWAARTYGADIARRAAEAAELSRSLLRLRDPARWAHMLIVTAATAIPGVAALIACRRRRLPVAWPLIVASSVVLLVGYHLGGRYWDDRAPAAEFARLAAERVGADTRIASWGDPQAKIVFYFDRNIPSVIWRRRWLIRQYGQEDGVARWNRWLADAEQIRWMFSYHKQTAKIGKHGFEVDLTVRSRQKKPVVYTLSVRAGRPSPARP